MARPGPSIDEMPRSRCIKRRSIRPRAPAIRYSRHLRRTRAGPASSPFADLVWALNSVEVLPPLGPNGTGARDLRPTDLPANSHHFGIAPSTIRTSAGTPKGYQLAQFDDALFARYLPGRDFEPPHRHSPYGTGISYTFAAATDECMLRFEMNGKPLHNGHCGVVAGRVSGHAAMHGMMAGWRLMDIFEGRSQTTNTSTLLLRDAATFRNRNLIALRTPCSRRSARFDLPGGLRQLDAFTAARAALSQAYDRLRALAP